ncbi:MAG: HAD-IC family P-type ATPase, partial [Anaeroplasmataceae bacterium]|nr:HAD-IC family P-type ATPase [Anaeroplasmataceae bacterium]
MKEKIIQSFEKNTISEVEEILSVDEENGLTQAEVSERENLYGPNELKIKKRKSGIKIFLEELNNPMIFVLFAAIAVTVGISIYDTIQTLNQGGTFNFLKTGDWPDVIIILFVIFLNALIGTIQELKAETSLEALKKMSAPESTVIRDGKKVKLPSSKLVPGDILILEEGDTIGADIRLIESHNLKIIESSLTGESTAVEKDANIVFNQEISIGDRINCAYMSTTVSYGRGKGIVTKTGMNTEIGKIAEAISEPTLEPTPLQKILAKLSKMLGFVTLGGVLYTSR